MAGGAPALTSIAGTGAPRLIIIKSDVFYTSTGTETYTDTSVTESGSPDLSGVIVNMRIRATKVISGQPDRTVWAKITAVDDSTDTITVDEWIGGTPTNSQTFYVDGWVSDLPRCQNMVETFEPDILVHNLYRSRKSTKMFGWKYKIALDYSRFISPDTIALMRRQLAASENDEIIVVPHKDRSGNNYGVYYSEAINLSWFGIETGYKDMVLTFEGKYTVPSWPILGGYGYGYGTDYGTQL